MFGIPPYGGSIQQQLVYTNDAFCEPAQGSGKSKWTPANPPAPFILMIDRGECSFVTKVRNAQKAGAAGVLIADTSCLCVDTVCINQTDAIECEASEPIMADDGSGADVSIPAFLVYRHDAESVKATLKDGSPVRVEMSFAIPAPDSRVEYTLWTSPADPVARDFLNTFKDAAVALGKDAFFTPQQYIYDGVKAHCQSSDGEDMCANLCTNEGRYCSTDPDNDLDFGISGADVVRESLRRICVWNMYGEDGIGEKWWDYIIEFMFRCDNPDTADQFINPDCISDALVHAKIDEQAISKCMDEAGGFDGNGTNSLLEMELMHATQDGVIVLPTLYVNQVPLRGQLSTSEAFHAICSGYAPGYEPQVCTHCVHCPTSECFKTGKCPHRNSGGVSFTTFGSTLFFVTLIFITIAFIQYRRQQSYMREQVRGIMAEYVTLDGSQGPVDTSLALEEEDDKQFTIT